ncbi:MAG: protein kinase [Pyrinomonadaceae bacterium]|nr:protein kinase [Pyrinomonadaceae bacterium]
MKPERFQQIDRILQSALEVAPEERGALVDKACAGDQELRRAVESLIESHERAGSFIETPALKQDAKLIAGERRLTTGSSIAHYKIIEQLGTGGMGEVYAAQDTRLRRKVALKILPSQFTRHEERVRRFEQEARAASALNHPNILTIYEINSEDDVYYIATELIEGETLRERMTKAQINLSDLLDIAVQIASALTIAHEAGIVHRDIKPENVMIRADGYVKVLDFGLAKLAERAASVPNLEASTQHLLKTAPGMVMGTVSYMSPEQARGQVVDARTDVWSLGVVLYEMAAQRRPFDGETMNHTLVSIMEKEPKALSEHGCDVPAELERIITKALAKKVDERYQTSKDLLIALRRLKKRLEVEAEVRSDSATEVGIATAATNAPIDAPETGTGSALRATDKGTAQQTSSVEYLVSEFKRHRTGATFALAAIIIFAVSVAYFGFGFGKSKNIDSLAVLPFTNVGGDPNAEYFSNGVTETLINSLSLLPDLKVMSRNSVFRYKGQEVDAREVARVLGVQAILTGRIIQRGDELSINVELVDASDNTHIWGEQYNRKIADILLVERDIAREITEKLRVRLTGEDARRVTKSYTANVEAYQLYLKGRFFWDKGTFEGSQKSIEFYNAAIENDPAYALAYAGLADSYLILGRYHGVPPREAMPRAEAAARRALEIDNALAEAYASLGAVSATYNWNWAEAERNYQRAISLNPNYAPAHYRYAEMLANIGRFDQAVTEARRAQELDPLSLTSNINVAGVLYKARRYDEALEQLREILEMNSNFAPTHLYFGINYLQKGMHEEAISAFKRALTLSNNSPDMMGLLGYAYASAGKMDEAQAILDQLEKITPPRYVAPYTRAQIYIALGDKDRAFVWLEKAYEERTWLMGILKVDPLFDPLRSDTRFADLLRRMNFYQ